jgi:hypothetical protein
VQVRAARLLAVTLVGVGVLGYSAWLVEFFLPTGVSQVHQQVRELSGEGTPYRDVFRIGAVVSGLAFLLAGPTLVRLAPVHWTARLSSAAVSVFGMLVLMGVAYPRSAGIELLVNVVFVLGAGSLVLWWPRGWRSVAVAGLALALLTWLAMLVLTSMGPDHFIGVVSRVQVLGRAVLLSIGASYLFRGPAPRTP